jgi:hypothetical protein
MFLPIPLHSTLLWAMRSRMKPPVSIHRTHKNTELYIGFELYPSLTSCFHQLGLSTADMPNWIPYHVDMALLLVLLFFLQNNLELSFKVIIKQHWNGQFSFCVSWLWECTYRLTLWRIHGSFFPLGTPIYKSCYLYLFAPNCQKETVLVTRK